MSAWLRQFIGPRRGRDDSYWIIPFLPGNWGFGIPTWGWMVLVYLLGGMGLVLAQERIGEAPARLFGALWPACCGLLDLIRRLRTVEYEYLNPAGYPVVARASLLDRLTLRECGWYFPLLVLPMPLWLIGLPFALTYLDIHG